MSGTAAPEVIPVAPVWGGDLNLAQMGMPDGIILSGGQRQGGVSFTPACRSGGDPFSAQPCRSRIAGDGEPQRHPCS
ncbi:hypothetical protein LNQ03_18935 [Klebsiella pneumoniae subsp. pneumoniae]|nr:hypothetical protein [Klebsiella pneumoniae subsp. pneumoniae]